MPDITTLALFVAASLALLIVPGPTLMYIVARGIHQGRAAALVSTLGVETGTLLQLLAATFGLSTLVMSSERAFEGLKLLGVAYLLCLGFMTIWDRGGTSVEAGGERMSLGPIFLQGVLVEALNPKTAVFFLAFLPQFADPERGPVTWQILAFGLAFLLLALCNDILVGLLAGTLGKRLSGRERFLAWQRQISAGTYISLATLAAPL